MPINILTLTVREPDVVFVNCVPFFEDNFIVFGASLCGDELLEIANGVVCIALYPHLLAQSIVACDFQHFSICKRLENNNNK
jgi:hypothetical protein